MALLTHLQHSSFVEPSSSYTYKMDQQVPASVVAGIEPIPQPHRGSDFAGFWTAQNPVGNKPVELPRFPRNETPRIKSSTSLEIAGSGYRDTTVDASNPPEKNPVSAADARCEDESQGNTSAVDLPDAALKQDFEAPIPRSRRFDSIVNQEHLLGQAIPAREPSAEIFQRQRSLKSAGADAAIRRVDEASILSSRRSSNHSSRSLCQGCLLQERFNKNPPQVLPQPPGNDGVIHILKDEILFPGNTNRLPQLKIGNSRTEHLSRLSKEPMLGGSCRETRSSASLGVSVCRAPTSLPTSPCSSSIEFIRALKSSKESRASKLLRKLKLTGISSRVGAGVDTRAGKRNGSSRGFGKLSKEKGLKAATKPIVSQHQKLVQRWELQMRESRNYGLQFDQHFGLRMKYATTIQSECMKVDGYNSIARPGTSTLPSVQSQEGNAAALQQHSMQTRGSRWHFKWRWGLKSASRMTGKRVARPHDLGVVNLTRHSSAISGAARGVSPTANITNEAGATLYSKSDRYLASGRGDEKRGSSTRSRHRRRSSWGCASHASTAVLTSGSSQRTARHTPRSLFLDDSGATESSQVRSNVGGSRVSRVRGGGSQSCRIEEAYRNFQESFRGVGGHSFRSVGGQSFRSIGSGGGQSFRSIGSGGGQSFRSIGSGGGQSFRSIGSGGGQSFRSIGSGGGQSFRNDQVFEDCHESFRGIGSPGSCGSFRSLDSVSVKSVGGSNRFPSMEDMEWNSRLPPPLPGNQKLTVDVASLCKSSSKFVFKCREIQYFNRFLKTQRKCVLRGSEKGNTDCFHIILSGADLELSSMVTAMCYAWFLENTVPKVTGETWHAIPVFDKPRRQMHKRKDAAWLFDACGIDAATLIFADEVELAGLARAGRAKTSVIGQHVLATRNEVGSVCTLLGEKLLAEAQCLLEPRYMKTLLLAGILLETENLDFASKRDTEMTTMLLVGSGSLGRNGFFNQLKRVADDERVSEFVTRNYGDAQQSSGGKLFSAAAQSKVQEEADQEQFDKDSLFTPSQDQTSTSEAGTISSLEEDSPRLKQRSSKYSKLHPPSAPVRSHRLPSASREGRRDDEKSVALRRKAATGAASSRPVCGARSPVSTRMQKRLFLYQA